jgi:hypothetical protein
MSQQCHYVAQPFSTAAQRQNHTTQRAKNSVDSALLQQELLALGLVCGLSKSDFHFINDNAEWLQMDKARHVFSSYQLGSF